MPRKRRTRVYRSKRKMRYHGREGYPMIHVTDSEKQFIMVRKRGGGTKRLFLKAGTVPAKYREAN